MGYVINHETEGVFVGEGLGLCFFTNLDCAGQDRVCVFSTREKAESYVKDYLHTMSGAFSYIEVKTDRPYATISDLIKADLREAAGKLAAEKLAREEPSGPLM